MQLQGWRGLNQTALTTSRYWIKIDFDGKTSIRVVPEVKPSCEVQHGRLSRTFVLLSFSYRLAVCVHPWGLECSVCHSGGLLQRRGLSTGEKNNRADGPPNAKKMWIAVYSFNFFFLPAQKCVSHQWNIQTFETFQLVILWWRKCWCQCMKSVRIMNCFTSFSIQPAVRCSHAFLLFQGRFRINLSGTGFKVAEDISWVSQGNYAVADVQKSQVWTIY